MGHSRDVVIGWGSTVPVSMLLKAARNDGNDESSDDRCDEEVMNANEYKADKLKLDLHYQQYEFDANGDAFVTWPSFSHHTTVGRADFDNIEHLLQGPSEAQILAFGKKLAKLLNLHNPLARYPVKFGCFTYEGD